MPGNMWIALGAFNAMIAVLAGAFAAHALRERLSVEMQAVFETGARYHMYHALALVAVGALALFRPSRKLQFAGWAFLTGILLFSGSLYVLALSGVRGWGAVTPFGGGAFLLGWGLLAAAAVSGRRGRSLDG